MRFNSQMESHVVWWLLKVNNSRLVVWSTGQKCPMIDSPDPQEIGLTFYPYVHPKKVCVLISVFPAGNSLKTLMIVLSHGPLWQTAVPSDRQLYSLTESCSPWQRAVLSSFQLSPLTDRQKGRQADRQVSPLTDSVVVSLWGCPPAVLCITTPNWWRCPLWQTAVFSDREKSSLTDRQTGVLSHKKVSSSVHCCSAI